MARAEKPTMDADGGWIYRWGSGVDGDVHRGVQEGEVIIAVRNDRIAGRFVGREEGDPWDSRCSGEIVGKDVLIIAFRVDRKDGYTALNVGRFTETGRIQGTWDDTTGNSGDFELVKLK